MSYKIAWTRVDLTVVLQQARHALQSNGPQQTMLYECEMEISDIKHLLQYMDNDLYIRKIIRKFLLNQIALSRMVVECVLKVLERRDQNNNLIYARLHIPKGGFAPKLDSRVEQRTTPNGPENSRSYGDRRPVKRVKKQ